MMKLGLCCGGGLCCALLSGALWLGGGTSVVGQVAEVVDGKTVGCDKAGCTKAGCKKHATAEAPCGMLGDNPEDVELTADEQKVVAYIADKIEDGQAPMISGEELEQEVGLSVEAVEQLDESKLRAGVMAELSRRNFDMASLGGNCSKYNACSVDRNLMNATGEELERYEAEVALDGSAFTDRVAPDFTLPDTKGRQVSLSEHRGQNVAVVSRAWELDVEYPLVVSEGKEISKAYDSRMVPSVFLIDEQGNLTRKLVGFKDKATLDQAFGELVGS